eukprot:14987059-Heterocapsa_arctica.AAC.1
MPGPASSLWRELVQADALARARARMVVLTAELLIVLEALLHRPVGGRVLVELLAVEAAELLEVLDVVVHRVVGPRVEGL